jgi:hypothetical protein
LRRPIGPPLSLQIFTVRTIVIIVTIVTVVSVVIVEFVADIDVFEVHLVIPDGFLFHEPGVADLTAFAEKPIDGLGTA